MPQETKQTKDKEFKTLIMFDLLVLTNSRKILNNNDKDTTSINETIDQLIYEVDVDEIKKMLEFFKNQKQKSNDLWEYESLKKILIKKQQEKIKLNSHLLDKEMKM